MQTPTKEEIEFSYAISVIVSADITKQYAGGLATMLPKGYKRNKAQELEQSCDKTIKALSRDLLKALPHLQTYMEERMELIYDTIGLAPENQSKVMELIKSLKNDQKESKPNVPGV